MRRRKNNWEQASLVALRRESAQRVVPRCPHFGVCGGCAMQHLHVGAQVATKQRALEDALWHLGKVRPEQVLRPIEGPAWGYRHRARLSVRHVAKKGGVLVGFHERKSSYVADMPQLRRAAARTSATCCCRCASWSARCDARDRLPQIELAVGDDDDGAGAAPPRAAARGGPASGCAPSRATHGVEWWLQPKGPDTAHPLDGAASALDYTLPEFGIAMPFRPTDFTQVNHDINQVLVSRARAPARRRSRASG